MNGEILSNLQPQAKMAAMRLLSAFPFLSLTSGRRCVDDQCRAMAVNEAHARDWVAGTYRDSPVEEAVVAWLAANPTITDVPGLETGILGVLARFPPAALRSLSWHLSGEAFDVQPLTDERAPAVTSFIRDLVTAQLSAGNSAKFLAIEAGLLRWHVQIAEPEPKEPT